MFDTRTVRQFDIQRNVQALDPEFKAHSTPIVYTQVHTSCMIQRYQVSRHVDQAVYWAVYCVQPLETGGKLVQCRDLQCQQTSSDRPEPLRLPRESSDYSHCRLQGSQFRNALKTLECVALNETLNASEIVGLRFRDSELPKSSTHSSQVSNSLSAKRWHLKSPNFLCPRTLGSIVGWLWNEFYQNPQSRCFHFRLHTEHRPELDTSQWEYFLFRTIFVFDSRTSITGATILNDLPLCHLSKLAGNNYSRFILGLQQRTAWSMQVSYHERIQ